MRILLLPAILAFILLGAVFYLPLLNETFLYSIRSVFKDYVAIVYYSLTSFIGVSGVLLGMFYYLDKHRKDQELRDKESVSRFIREIESKFEVLNEMASAAFFHTDDSKEKFGLMQFRIKNVTLDMLNLLESPGKSDTFEKNELSTMVRALSFVETHSVVMGSKYRSYKEYDFSIDAQIWHDLLLSSRNILVSKRQ